MKGMQTRELTFITLTRNACLDSIRATDTIAISYISTPSRLIHRERTNMCRAASFKNMSAVVGTLPDVLTLALAVDVFNIIEGVLHDTLFEVRWPG